MGGGWGGGKQGALEGQGEEKTAERSSADLRILFAE